MSKQKEPSRRRDEARTLLAAVSLLGASLGVTASTPADAQQKSGQTSVGTQQQAGSQTSGHMAAGTQDAMKRVLFGAAGVTGGRTAGKGSKLGGSTGPTVPPKPGGSTPAAPKLGGSTGPTVPPTPVGSRK